ncbi:uncharacterized protein LOC110876739 [Helianthus annuus]|uniref:uncharacterized protein LOC110876739 n=1 Tax=Helianthus annuus TaxID=4232 RepID=UPI000B8F1F65|nr:uncharacterized protein LOC110876739 [Helianthus annuus]
MGGLEQVYDSVDDTEISSDWSKETDEGDDQRSRSQMKQDAFSGRIQMQPLVLVKAYRGGRFLRSPWIQIEKLNLVIKELVKENDEEKERLNGIIARLLAEKKKDKVDKDAMPDTMPQIEAMLTSII